jgi:hypothetical protein
MNEYSMLAAGSSHKFREPQCYSASGVYYFIY